MNSRFASRAWALLALAVIMFAAGVVYGIVSGELAISATTEEQSSFADGDSKGSQAEQGDGSPSCLSDPAVLEELRTQRENLAKAQKDLAAREQELKAREQAVADELKKVQAIRDDVNKTDVLRKKENQERV